jgi:serine/threonine protein kinase
LYALKKVKIHEMNEKDRDNAINEVRILASIQHPNVVSYRDAFVDNNMLWYALPLIVLVLSCSMQTGATCCRK